jgi:P2 family phage contractile tail tube protein
MAIPINHICDLVVWMDGVDYVGHCTGVEFDPIEFVKTEEERLGLIGTPKLFAALDPITVTLNWGSMRADWSIIMSNPLEAFNMQGRGSISVHGPQGRIEEQPYLVELTGISDQASMGKFKQKESGEYETTLSCNYIRQTVNGVATLEIDIYNYIVSVNGTDLMQGRRGNLGF